MKKLIAVLYLVLTAGYLRLILAPRKPYTYFFKYEIRLIHWAYDLYEKSKVNHFKTI